MDFDSPIGKIVVAAAVGGVMAIIYIGIRVSYLVLRGMMRSAKQATATNRMVEGHPGNPTAVLPDAAADNWVGPRTFPALIALAFLAGALGATLYWRWESSYEECMLSQGSGQPKHMMQFVHAECRKRFPKD